MEKLLEILHYHFMDQVTSLLPITDSVMCDSTFSDSTPPSIPVPVPNGIIEIRCLWQSLTTWLTSSTDCGQTTAEGKWPLRNRIKWMSEMGLQATKFCCVPPYIVSHLKFLTWVKWGSLKKSSKILICFCYCRCCSNLHSAYKLIHASRIK